MPATKYDWEAIETHYNTTGRSFQETSEAMGVPLNTLIVRSKRKGWKTPGNARRKIEEGREEMKELVPHLVTMNTVEAVNNTVEKHREAFVGNMATALSRASEEILASGSPLEHSRRMVDLSTAAKSVLGIGAETDSARLSVNILNMSAEMLAGFNNARLPE